MVGEIRDGETMQIAIEAAMTGHLVLSTLHTNSAAGTLPRLLDMGAESFLVASTANVIIAQRLVRKLCSECREAYKLDDKDIESLKATFKIDDVLKILKESPQTKDIVKAKDTWKTIKLYKPKGCEQCHNEGYKGRNGIYEVLEVDDEIGKMIVENASADQIEESARKKGMLTMSEDGFIKAALGITSIEEILRVTKE